MSQFVDISVKCVSEECKNCDDLVIAMDSRFEYGDGLQIFMRKDYICKNYFLCERLMEVLRKNNTEDNEKDRV